MKKPQPVLSKMKENTKIAMTDRGGRNAKIQGNGYIGMDVISMTEKDTR